MQLSNKDGWRACHAAVRTPASCRGSTSRPTLCVAALPQLDALYFHEVERSPPGPSRDEPDSASSWRCLLRRDCAVSGSRAPCLRRTACSSNPEVVPVRFPRQCRASPTRPGCMIAACLASTDSSRACSMWGVRMTGTSRMCPCAGSPVLAGCLLVYTLKEGIKPGQAGGRKMALI
jgi:hypothetical protein